MLDGAVIVIAPVLDVGSPEFCHVPFLLKNNLLLSKSRATPSISPVVKVFP